MKPENVQEIIKSVHVVSVSKYLLSTQYRNADADVWHVKGQENGKIPTDDTVVLVRREMPIFN
ncbi:hypothetical protein [Candidatus Azobacteroides pseudotrichonymphae]|uniref:hypothetical protein n=1 Tax=Candidatus Azobacteroides pseudotrichonymphae TaxID=511435 RepID=UPI0005A0EB1C|nr:hypothetical protein [Candidatus Azobacteroides pseudotrichonymphae]